VSSDAPGRTAAVEATGRTAADEAIGRAAADEAASRPAAPQAQGRFARLSIRNKLLAMVLLPLAGVLPVLGAILLWWSSEAFDRVLITKIRADLGVAQGYFERTLAEVAASTAAIAESRALADQLAAPRERQAALLEQLRHRERLDFVNLRAADGTIRVTHRGTTADDPGERPGRPDEHGVVVMSLAQLATLAPELTERVKVPLVPTRNAAPTTREVEDRAMVLLATRVVWNAAGQAVARVQGGVLLNRNLAFIDHINEIVYPEGSLPFGSRGTATLFLDDVRISTNVRLFGEAREQRAIGTRVSKAVRDAVLGEGRTWLDRAFVVSDWYVSAYLPLVGVRGDRVGMLYVGYLERPFTQLRYAMLAAIGVVFFAVMITAAWVSLRWARSIFHPLVRMEATMRSVEAGALEARVGAVQSGDEIGRLAGHLDQLLDTVGDKARELQRWNAELDAKVAARTRELQETQRHLVRSEKLATVGQLTASIAHEVNNPIAVIQGNLDLVRELLDPEARAKVVPELRLVDAQIERIRLIVTQLLQFARPTEYAGYVESVDVARLLDESLVLVQHLLAKTQIAVERDLRAARRVAINRQELQQVFVNLLVNAVHAMPQGGRLVLRTMDAGEAARREGDGGDAHDHTRDDTRERTHDQTHDQTHDDLHGDRHGDPLADTHGEVHAEVIDTGPGLAPELLAQLFQPFATRKKEGTGLGLFISRGIVERYGGDIRASNRDDGVRGARFVVVLKAEGGPACQPSVEGTAALAVPTLPPVPAVPVVPDAVTPAPAEAPTSATRTATAAPMAESLR
jgi:signal transduction histidine kinase